MNDTAQRPVSRYIRLLFKIKAHEIAQARARRHGE